MAVDIYVHNAPVLNAMIAVQYKQELDANLSPICYISHRNSDLVVQKKAVTINVRRLG